MAAAELGCDDWREPRLAEGEQCTSCDFRRSLEAVKIKVITALEVLQCDLGR